ncbi:MAG: PBP1A family penicillin-binding protein [Hyphomicrobiaceae bacterium]|nr:MAG: PBP1A family penicillin-binding protein [Hyphomicrobiaceae bacterium]
MGLFDPPPQHNASEPPGEPAPAIVLPRQGLRRRVPWVIRLLILAPVYLGLPAAAVIACAFVYYTTIIPNPMELRQRESTPVVRILARDGSVLAERGGADAYTPFEHLPRHLIDAVVATEDRRFFEHWGLDPSGLMRAAFTNLRAGRFVQGGSTLTQQLAKNLFLSSKRTLGRKFEELVMALWLELRLSKRDILELYLNRVYFGGGAYGIETAARRFFGKSARELTLAESAMLAGLLKAPSKFSPAWNPAMARARARSVLAKMVEAGLLSPEQGEQASSAAIRFADAITDRGQSGFEYAVDAVLERLPPLAGTDSREMVVETTIDGDLQRRAQAIVHDLISTEGRAVDAGQAGLVLLDMKGGIRVLIGGRAYAESQFNRALKAKRQPGSAFKTFVYLAALESGLTPNSIVQDLPILGAGWSPRNEGGRYRGAVTLREAFAQSMNAAAARLHMSVGPRRTAAVARRLGIGSELRAEASLALGTSEVTLVELTGAYGVLANGGRNLEPHIIRRVRTGTGQVLYARPEESGKTLVAPAHVGALNDMLNAVLVSGTGRRAALPKHPAAGKTGTSQDFRDAWFVGFTAHFVAGVWVGNDDGRTMNRVMGGNLPARLWRDVMVLAHEGYAPAPLPGTVPEGGTLALRARIASEPASGQPLLPMERIEPDFVARALAADSGRAELLPPHAPAASGSALERLRRGLGLGG